MPASQLGARGLRWNSESRLPASDLISASELLSSWLRTRTRLCHAQFLLAQGAAQVRDHDELMAPSILPERAAAHAPPARAGRKGPVEQAVGLAHQGVGEAQFVGGVPHQSLARPGEEGLRGLVDEAPPAFVVEGEDGNVDDLHDRVEQGKGFKGVKTVGLQFAAEMVDFREGIAHRGSVDGPARAYREVALAQAARAITANSGGRLLQNRRARL